MDKILPHLVLFPREKLEFGHCFTELSLARCTGPSVLDGIDLVHGLSTPTDDKGCSASKNPNCGLIMASQVGGVSTAASSA